MSFVLHEVAEYVVAAALVAVGTRASGAAELLLVVTGGALLLVGVVTAGRLGALSWLSRRSHHVADLVVVAAVALSPAVFFGSLHLVGTVIAELVALVLLRIERGTLYADQPRRAVPGAGGRAGGGRQSPVPVGGRPVAGGPLPAEPQVSEAAPQVSEAAQRIGAGAATAATVAATAAAQIVPVAGRAARIGFRSMGLVAGATRKATRDHRAERARRDG